MRHLRKKLWPGGGSGPVTRSNAGSPCYNCPVDHEPLVEPIQFGRYQLLERLTAGGMAEIFRAKSIGAHGFEKPVVIKCILPDLAEDEDFVRMFIDEAKVMVQLHHPKVVQVLDFGQEQGRYFIAMEYVKGIDCLALLRCCAHLKLRPTTGIAVHIAAEVLDALDYAHNLAGTPMGVLHRDISPSNIFLSELGEVKLGDFGIAVAATAKGPTAATRMKGKYGYMAPELVTGDAFDSRSDVFSVGVVLAEMLMIRRLFIAKSEIEVLLKVRDVDLSRLSKYGTHVPPDLMRILESALRRDPESRYQDAATFRDALHRYLFENRLMVHNHDVQRFLDRLKQQEHEKEAEEVVADVPITPEGAGQTGADSVQEEAATPTVARTQTRSLQYASQTGERVCVIPRAAVEREEPEPAQEMPQTVIGRKRRITLGPPPRPEPVPSHLPETGEEPRLSTADALAAMPEIDGATTGSADFKRLEIEELDLPPLDSTPAPEEARRVAAARISGPLPSMSRPAHSGDVAQRSLVALLFQLAMEEETGLLTLQSGEAVKEIYLVDGDPHFVASNLPEELLGQYLVQKGVISEGELAMALAMLPHFEGKLGSTLIGLKLMRPVQVLRHLTHQVRLKLVNAFTWDQGDYAFFRGQRAEQEAAPLGLDAFGMIGAGVGALSAEAVERRLEGVMRRCVAAAPSPVPPEVFRLGAQGRAVYDKLDGRHSVGQMAALYDNLEQRKVFLQAIYLFLECKLADVR